MGFTHSINYPTNDYEWTKRETDRVGQRGREELMELERREERGE